MSAEKIKLAYLMTLVQLMGAIQNNRSEIPGVWTAEKDDREQQYGKSFQRVSYPLRKHDVLQLHAWYSANEANFRSVEQRRIEMSFQRKVLVATDASKYASEIINTVAAANWRDGSELHLLTVVHKTPNWESQEEYMRQCSLIQKDHLSLLQAALPNCIVKAECIDGVPAELIIKRAIDENFDLIILGSHGDTGVRPEHVGSIAAAVVNRAPCSVAVVKVGKAELKAAEMLTKAAAGKRN